MFAATVPNLLSYDPAFAYEIAVIVRDGIKRMYADQEDIFYYITVTNQNYKMPPMPEGIEDGIVKGMYAYRYVENAEINLLGSGAIMQEVLNAADQLEKIGKRVTVWSVTSYTELNREGLAIERQRMLAVDDSVGKPYLETLLEDEEGIFVAASDYQKALPESIKRWIPNEYLVLGTDGFGLSESREELRDHFEVSADWIVFAALSALARTNREPVSTASKYANSKSLDLTKSSVV